MIENIFSSPWLIFERVLASVSPQENALDIFVIDGALQASSSINHFTNIGQLWH